MTDGILCFIRGRDIYDEVRLPFVPRKGDVLWLRSLTRGRVQVPGAVVSRVEWAMEQRSEQVQVWLTVRRIKPPEIETLEAMDEAYAERNLVVQAFAWAMAELGYSAGWGVDPATLEYPVLYVQTPAGQVSWHIPRAERVYEPGEPSAPFVWDGHTTAMKDARLRLLFAYLGNEFKEV